MSQIDFSLAPATVVEGFRRLTEMEDHGYTFLDAALKPTHYSFKALWQASEARGRKLIGLGARRGERVAMVLAQPEDFVISFLGCLIAGLVPVPMFPPLSFGKLDSYVDSAVTILATAGTSWLLTDKTLSSVMWQVMPRVKTIRELYTIDKLDAAPASTEPIPEITADDLAFLQFTSGSTSTPKGVMVTHGNLIANAHSIGTAMELDHRTDRGVSWLPLYHDMGLIGFVITPLMRAMDIVFVPTLSFVKRPNVWMQAMHDYKATLAFGPNFAYALAGRRAGEKEIASWDLSRVRLLGCGAEPINAAVIEEFERVLAPTGLRRGVVMSAYGMAEATLAISFGERLTPLDVVSVDAETFRATGTVVAPIADSVALSFVSCGKTFPDHEVGIADAEGNFLEDGQEGEIVLKGPSITKGYWENPEATAAVLRDGWLRTGDLGFLRGGDVFITGRCKDLIILNGKNHHPQTIEWAIQELDGVRRGNVVAFSRPGRESEELVVVCETKSEPPADLAEVITRTVADQLSLKVSEVVLLKAGTLPKTSSGKVQRRKTRDQFLSGELGQDGVRTLGTSGETLTVARHLTRSFLGRMTHTASKIFARDPERQAG